MGYTPPQTLDVPRFLVAMDDGTDTGRVYQLTIRPADQMKAERVGRDMGLGPLKDSTMTYTGLWCWAAMARTGDYAGTFSEWRDACLGWDKLDDDTPGGDDGADPTI